MHRALVTELASVPAAADSLRKRPLTPIDLAAHL